MNLLILFLLIPLSSYAGSPPTCNELEKYITDYEKDFQSKTINECGSLDIKKFIAERPHASSEFLEANKCSDLATIETELENLKIQEAVLTGINKLKVTIKESKENTKSKNSKTQDAAGKKFVDNLITAQHLETLLYTELGEEKKPLINELSAITDLSAENIEYRLGTICGKNKTGACDKKIFSPKGQTAVELVNLIKTEKLTPKKIQSWKNMLAIQKKGPAEGEDPSYSFNQMRKELGSAFDKIDNKQVLSKEQIAAIQNLPDFENNTDFTFVNNISELKDSKKLKIESDKFLLLLGDAKQRQMFEVQSKMSASIGKMDLSVLTQDQKAVCERSGFNFQEAKSCLDHLEKSLEKMTDNKANTARLLPALRTAVNYTEFLETKTQSCEKEINTQEIVSEECFNELNTDLASVNHQIMQLNTLKDKIGEENTDLMTFRNFAMTKWGTQKCDKNSLTSNIDFCDDATMISKEAKLILSDAMDITVLFAPKPEAEIDAKELCSEEDRKFTKAQERLCEFFDDTTSNIVKTNNEFVDGPTNAPDGEHEKAALRDAWIQGGANVMTQALRGVLNNQYKNQYYNPYQYNYTPWQVGRPMGIADSIMFNARYYGAYGFYMPSASSFTYSNVGLNLSPYGYRNTGSMTGSYFGF